MVRITVSRKINAVIDLVFKSVADISNLSYVVPDVVKVEIISEKTSGVGTCFSETRLMKGKESVTELEVTEYIENERIRMVADCHGTIWDSVFTVKAKGDFCELELVMDAKAHKILPKILNPMMKGLYKRGLEKHMDAVKFYCEKKSD
ncbi:SRPBCC family protein [Calditrichota bacterium]